MYDTEALKESVSLVALAGRHVALRKVTDTDGGEYAGPCPRCGGEDRFHVSAAGWWFCRQCHEKRGDAIEFVRWRDDLGFSEACELLGGQKVAPSASRGKAAGSKAPPVTLSRPSQAPSAAWQDRGRQFLAWAVGELWKSPEALGYLRGRGLADETIHAAGLGYNPRTLHDDPGRWGLEGKDVCLPVGWVIPCEVGGVLRYIKVRQPEGASPKYLAIRGSRKAGAVYALDWCKGFGDVILCEGEFNALILRQVLGPVCAVVSVGDAGNRPGEAELDALGRVGRWWLAYDPDKAGLQGRERLGGLSARARVLAWPFPEKDANDAYLAGRDLAEWAVGQVGPTAAPDQIGGGGEGRRVWLRYHLDGPLDGASEGPRSPRPRGDRGDEAAPMLRLWLALYAEYGRMGYDG